MTVDLVLDDLADRADPYLRLPFDLFLGVPGALKQFYKFLHLRRHLRLHQVKYLSYRFLL